MQYLPGQVQRVIQMATNEGKPPLKRHRRRCTVAPALVSSCSRRCGHHRPHHSFVSSCSCSRRCRCHCQWQLSNRVSPHARRLWELQPVTVCSVVIKISKKGKKKRVSLPWTSACVSPLLW